jgi:F-type H+-transporting ATPase subunit delta
VSDPAAAVYADALFAAAEEAGSLERVGRDLDDLVGELVSSPVLTRVLFNPAVAPEGKANVLRRLTDDADPLVTRTLLLLLENGRLGLMPDLQQAFGERYGVAARKLDVQLTTAVEVDEGPGRAPPAAARAVDRPVRDAEARRRPVDPRRRRPPRGRPAGRRLGPSSSGGAAAHAPEHPTPRLNPLPHRR